MPRPESSYDRRRLRQWLAGDARADGVARRDLLKLLAAAGLTTAAPVALGTPAAAAAAATAAAPGIVKPLPDDWFTIRGTNAETKFPSLAGTGYHTPIDHFFVRNHTSTPVLDARTWKLTVWGDGLAREEPVEFGLDDLKR
ncbi:sulfite oxidase, partial [Streptomyces sp. NPDC058272]